ncbi:Saccharopine dehydrogenase [Fusarium oxysporum f. sp. albedinis]|nr:Saccharopine dehydrogenase [Fusarium oxysporum f. sp. albedinis]
MKDEGSEFVERGCRDLRIHADLLQRNYLLAAKIWQELPPVHHVKSSSSWSQRVVSKRSPRSVNFSLQFLSVVSFPIPRRQ